LTSTTGWTRLGSLPRWLLFVASGVLGVFPAQAGLAAVSPSISGDPATRIVTGSSAATAPSSAATGISVLGSLVRTFQTAAGSAAEARILVRNVSSEPQTVRAYLTDYAPPGGEGSGFPSPGTVPRSNAGWLKLLPEEQVLLPGETGSVSVLIQVPDVWSEPGTFWSVVMVEGVSPAVLAPPDSAQVRVAIREVFRTAVRIVTDVQVAGLLAEPSLRFADSALRMGDRGPELYLSLGNSGPVSLSLELWVELFDERGASLGRFTARNLALLPGEVGERQIALEGVPPGAYEALVVADNRDAAVFGNRYRLNIPAPYESRK
jgi:hypothetical protein